MSSSVPVIDFGSGIDVPAARHAEWVPSDDQRNLAKEIIDAFSTVGFICLVNTGITQDQIEKLVEETKKFFNKDVGYKAGYTKGVMSNVGWTAVGRETLNPAERKAGDYKETFNFQPTMPGKELPESMDVLKQWWAQSSDLACQVMKLMGLGLNLADPSIIADSHMFGSTDNETAIRVNFYPSTAGKNLKHDQVRCSEHSDYGSITLLVQDSQGLEVMNRSTKEYEAVKAPPGGVVVNIGDAMQFWTSDKLVANMHRVLVAEDPKFQAEDRVSIPFFAMPDQSTLIQCLLGDNKYPPVTMRDWLKKKIDAAFKERQGD